MVLGGCSFLRLRFSFLKRRGARFALAAELLQAGVIREWHSRGAD